MSLFFSGKNTHFTLKHIHFPLSKGVKERAVNVAVVDEGAGVRVSVGDLNPGTGRLLLLPDAQPGLDAEWWRSSRHRRLIQSHLLHLTTVGDLCLSHINMPEKRYDKESALDC